MIKKKSHRGNVIPFFIFIAVLLALFSWLGAGFMETQNENVNLASGSINTTASPFFNENTSLQNPADVGSLFGSMSSDYFLITMLLITPALLIGAWIILAWLRGVTP